MAITVPIVSTWDGKGVDKATRDIQKAEGGFGKFSAGVKAVTPIAAGAFAAVAAGAALTIKAAEAAATSNARLEQVFKSMGDTTGRAASDAIKYGDALARSTGMDQNAIKAAQAKLATFSAVSDESARMAGMFDRTTAAAADLSAAGFGDMSSTAVQLGKALQDPVKGLTALGKSGVSFTKQEQEQIKALTAANRGLEAQDIILKAVEKQVGGVAVATANTSDKMKVGYSQAAEAIGTALLPAFDALAGVLGNVSGWISENASTFAVLMGVIAAVSGTVLVLSAALKTLAVIKSVITLLKSLNLTLLSSPWFWVVAAIAAVVAGLVWFFTQTEVGQKIVSKAMELMRAAFAVAFEWIQKAARVAWDVLTTLFKFTPVGFVITHLDTLKAAFKAVFDWIAKIVTSAWATIKSIFDRIAAAIATLRSALSSIGSIIGKIPGLGSASYSVAGVGDLGPSTRGSSTTYGGNTYNVYGAVDPVGTARQIRRLLGDDDRRNGR